MMLKPIFITALLAAPFPAQDPEPPFEFHRGFNEGLGALNARQGDYGVGLLERCLGERSEIPVVAFNIACAHSLKGNVDTGIEWLQKASDWGYGCGPAYIEKAASGDQDLKALRTDPRFPAVIASMRARLDEQRGAITEYAATAGIHVPESLKGEEEVGALVVLHRSGDSKDDVLRSSWREVAEELGVALVAPSGKVLGGATPKDGMLWLDVLFSIVTSLEDAQKTILPALTQLAERKTLDPERTWIVGDGESAIVALAAALRHPDRFRGVLIIDAPVTPAFIEPAQLTSAAEAGLQVRMVVSERSMYGIHPADVSMFTSQGRLMLLKAKIDVKLERYLLRAGEADPRPALIRKSLAPLSRSH